MRIESQRAAATQWYREKTGVDLQLVISPVSQHGGFYEFIQGGKRETIELWDKSLDSMALLEGQLNEDEKEEYSIQLYELMGRYDWFLAPPPQRLEAFLRAVNLWEDDHE